MSALKTDPVFLGQNKEISSQVLGRIVAHALRKDFGQHPSSIKKIGQATNANLRTIKNWYEGRSAPSSSHFILLARCSPTIRKFLFSHIFGRDFWGDFELIQNVSLTANIAFSMNGYSVHNHVTINGTITLNERQKWFLLVLQNERNAAAKNIVEKWGVSFRTARRDIQGLKDDGRIEYRGSKKSGHYNIVQRGS